ncbi:MAG: hypothetical protein WBP16_16500 [Ferruginibacter sp.]
MKLISKAFNRQFKFKTGDIILALLFFASICLTVWAVNIYRLTIIDTTLLFIVSAIGSVIAFFAINLLIKSSYSKIWTLFISIVIGSGTFYFGLLFLNQAFSDKKIINEDFQIISTGTLGRSRPTRCFQPYATIDFHGTEKQLVFYCDFAETIKNSSKVSLTYSKGLFGFYIIKTKQLIH